MQKNRLKLLQFFSEKQKFQKSGQIRDDRSDFIEVKRHSTVLYYFVSSKYKLKIHARSLSWIYIVLISFLPASNYIAFTVSFGIIRGCIIWEPNCRYLKLSWIVVFSILGSLLIFFFHFCLKSFCVIVEIFATQ